MIGLHSSASAGVCSGSTYLGVEKAAARPGCDERMSSVYPRRRYRAEAPAFDGDTWRRRMAAPDDDATACRRTRRHMTSAHLMREGP